MKAKILLIYCGGTIGMTKDLKSGSLKPFDFSNLLQQIPELKWLDCVIETFSFPNPIDSSDVSLKDWIFLVELIKKNYESFNGFVVLHGTDTMSFTASMLSFMIQGLQKPIIFTGSQLPIGDLRTDSKENLITSIHYASLQEQNKPIIKEVCLYFEYKLYRANRTSKFSSENFNAFISPNFPLLGESGVHLEIHKEYLFQSSKKLAISTELDNSIRSFYFFPNCDYQILEHWIENPEVKALILQTYGSGNIPMQEKLLKILRKSLKTKTIIIVLSQCKKGDVEFGKYQNSQIFIDIGAVNGKDITFEAAVTKTMFLLGKKVLYDEFKSEFEKNDVGEIS